MLKDSVKRRRNWQIKDQSRKIVLRPAHKAELPLRPEEGKPEIGIHPRLCPRELRPDIQWQHSHSVQCTKGFASVIKRHVFNIVDVSNVHIL